MRLPKNVQKYPLSGARTPFSVISASSGKARFCKPLDALTNEKMAGKIAFLKNKY